MKTLDTPYTAVKDDKLGWTFLRPVVGRGWGSTENEDRVLKMARENFPKHDVDMGYNDVEDIMWMIVVPK